MKKILCLLGCCLLPVAFTGCASLKSVMLPGLINKAARVTPLPPYSGAKAKIAVTDFTVEASKAGGEIGPGLRLMLVSALVNSNRFNVVENQGGATLIITAALREFEPLGSGGRAGIGGGGGVGSGRLGGLLGTSLNKAHLALDIRIADAATSKVITTNQVQGQASDIAGANANGFFGDWAQDQALSVYSNTPMEKAIRLCIIEAVRYISQAIPPDYYNSQLHQTKE